MAAMPPSLARFSHYMLPLTPQQPPPKQKADSILILKKDHVLELLGGGKVIRTYKVALGRGGPGA